MTIYLFAMNVERRFQIKEIYSFAKDYLSANQDAIENIKNIINNEKINCDFERQSSFVFTTNPSEVSQIKYITLLSV